jgi:hypothetical protein
VIGAAGCGKPEARYIPDADVARPALEAALNAWKNGEPNDSIKLEEKPVSLIDSRWRSGKKIEDFQVTEEVTSNPLRAYKVKIKFAKESAESETTYLVVGIDPLLIYRSEDFEREHSVY